MLRKKIFKDAPVSYSHFLQSKEPHIHCLIEARESVDIEFFRRSISSHYQHVYAKKKWQNWAYRFIFFTLGLIFLTLGFIIFFKTTNFACGFYVKNCALVKNGVDCLCLLLAGGAFAIGYKIHPEKDAIQYLIGKVEKELTHPAKNLQIEFNAIMSNLSHESFSPHQTIWIKKTLHPNH